MLAAKTPRPATPPTLAREADGAMEPARSAVPVQVPATPLAPEGSSSTAGQAADVVEGTGLGEREASGSFVEESFGIPTPGNSDQANTTPPGQAAPSAAIGTAGLAAAPERRHVSPQRSRNESVQVPTVNTESFASAPASAIKSVASEPVSTFSIDVDTASYSLVRSSLNTGQMPPPQAVRIEELVNYFDYAYAAPESAGTPFTTSVAVSETPWNADTRLMQIGLQGYAIPVTERQPLNLVFLIDTSGSMQDKSKLPLLTAGFRLLLSALNPDDEIAIVTYAGSTGIALQPTPASENATIMQTLDTLTATGSTAGAAGLQQAYALAETMGREGETTRVILATDGDFNVGISDPEALKTFIAGKRDSGTYLSVLGFGRGNLQDATMQALAQNGNGTAAYIDTLAEAQRVLVDDLTANFFPIASDVKIQVEFNPAKVSEYRLIGYETRALRREDFRDDRIDAGEIGAGHSVTALYEVTPKGSPAEQLPPLRYSTEADAALPASDASSGELAFVKLRYKLPGETTSRLVTTPVTADRQDIPAAERDFAAAVAAFGERLRGTGTVGWDRIEGLARPGLANDPHGYRAEFMRLVRLASAVAR
ncbi:DUF3520 domain-containing protein [Algicella marina]|uniref:DUF3520 domain-containing protein n=2 Tax=Algicella marina TaxID=2683284 RepID=A0A6P1T7E8_9RHOB|nr:DUF3520 domain-containing protein [Algicella marina]